MANDLVVESLSAGLYLISLDKPARAFDET